MAKSVYSPLDEASALVAGCFRGVALTGAGISTESGIPDFRSPGGIWTRHDPRRFDIRSYVSSADVRREAWRMRLELWSRPYEPNGGHRALADLERLGVLTGIVTQNIDGLHQAAGSRNVIELHGTARITGCLDCGLTMPTEYALERVRTGEDDPACPACGGILKPSTVSFGQFIPADVSSAAHDLVRRCDLLLVVGSSLQVTPAASLPRVAAEAGAKVVIVNREPTRRDDLADVVVNGEAGPVLAGLSERVARLRG